MRTLTKDEIDNLKPHFRKEDSTFNKCCGGHGCKANCPYKIICDEIEKEDRYIRKEVMYELKTKRS
jgi:hypothetical protein